MGPLGVVDSHIDLRPPKRQEIDSGTQNLEADNAEAQELIEAMQSEFNLAQGETEMLIMDMPTVPVDNVPIVLVQVAAKSGSSQTPQAIGICQIIDNTSGWPAGEVRIPNSIDPIASVDVYFYQRSHVDLNRAEGTVTILQPPKYGTLKSVDGEVGAYEYLPSSPTHAGKDSATFLVEIGGYKVKVMYVFHVLTSGVGSRPEDIKAICGPKGYWWKISTPSTLTDPSSLQFLLTQSGLDGTAVTFQVADLTGSAVGQTTNTTITLDTDAAGHGWYIDYTPYLNEEFLATSNPNEWVAKEGTDAYGKMDLLSVLWHEYGHAMGLDHSADSHDLMAATLSPGVRRLPDAETLAEFRRMLGYSLAGDNLPATPDIPQPDGPLPPNNGRSSNVRVARARITREGTVVIGEDGVEREQTEFQAAANPTLTSSSLIRCSGVWPGLLVDWDGSRIRP